MVRKAGREMGLMNARHTAYDWFGSHQYQRYFTEAEISSILTRLGIEQHDVIRQKKGLYRIRRRTAVVLDDEVHRFGAVR